MAIPDYQSIMLPLLKFLRDGKEHSLRESADYLADEFDLSEDELKEMLPIQAGRFSKQLGRALCTNLSQGRHSWSPSAFQAKASGQVPTRGCHRLPLAF